ncbi:hypothetical protein SAMN06298216_3547 [Spirosomataceae bacterium TFI 002]|nr:hypothetical protein SAMN06298216_3547 [Spirosomataceae bacterium TFI 002]
MCFVTQQAITNALPALMLEVDVIIPVYTHLAYFSRWNNGFNTVMQSKNPNLEIHPLFLTSNANAKQWNIDPAVCTCKSSICTQDCSTSWTGPESLENDLIAIVELLSKKIEEYSVDSVWYLNVGGGLKLHTIALQQVHVKLGQNVDNKASLVYLNSQSSPVTLNLYNNSFDLEAHVLKDYWHSNFLTIEEYTRLFFLNFTSKNDDENREDYNYQFLAEPDCRAFLAYMSNISNEEKILMLKQFKALMNTLKVDLKTSLESQIKDEPIFDAINKSILPAMITKFLGKAVITRNPPEVKLNSNSSLQGIFGDSKVLVTDKNYKQWVYKLPGGKVKDRINPGTLMEYFVTAKIERVLLNGGKVAEVAKSFNLMKGNIKYAEIDLLALTNEGRLAGIEIKTTKYTQEEIHAAQHKLRRISGALNIPCIVIPLFVEDREMPYLKNIKEGFKAISLLHKNGIRYCVFTNRPQEKDDEVYLLKTGRNDGDFEIVDKETIQENPDKIKIICKTTTLFFKSTGLL